MLVTGRSGTDGGCGVVMVVVWTGATLERETLGGVGVGELGRWDTYILDTGDCAPHRLKTLSNCKLLVTWANCYSLVPF